jgi:hypothetical protein
MKAYYFTADISLIESNKMRYLYIPEKEITIGLNPEKGKLTIKDHLHGHFLKYGCTEFKEILKKNKSASENIRYMGEIEIPENLSKEITSLTKKYKNLEKSAFKLEEKGNQTVKNIEEILKENF